MVSESQSRAQKKYRASNERQIRFTLNKKHDQDIINLFAGADNKLALFKFICRQYIKNYLTDSSDHDQKNVNF